MFRISALCRRRASGAWGLRSGFVSVLLAMSTVPAWADVIVIASNADAFPPGHVLKDAQTIEVASGVWMRVMLVSGRLQEIKGPASVKISTLGKGEIRNEGLWNDVRRLIAAQRRGSRTQVGAERSAEPRTRSWRRMYKRVPADQAQRAASFSWRRISIDHGGDVCVEKGAPLELQRASSEAALSVMVVDLQARKRAAAEFGSGATTAKWPRAIGTNVGRYTVVLPDGAKHDIRLRPIAPLPAADDTIRLLHSQRCLGQVDAWLRGQMTASR